MNGFLSKKTGIQFLGYALVSLAEYAAGVCLVSLTEWGHWYYLAAFTISQGFIGFGAFVVRKYKVFHV